jgi:hypothetical protein
MFGYLSFFFCNTEVCFCFFSVIFEESIVGFYEVVSKNKEYSNRLCITLRHYIITRSDFESFRSWKRYVPPNRLHGVITQKTIL